MSPWANHVIAIARQIGPRAQVALEFALQSLWSSRRRIWLVVLSAAIGFGAINSMLIIGSSVQARIQSSLDSFGGDILTLAIGGAMDDDAPDSFSSRQLEPHHSSAGRNNVADLVDLVSLGPLISGMRQVKGIAWVEGGGSCSISTGDVQGLHTIPVSPAVQPLLDMKLAGGRFLHPGDLGQFNLLLGATAWERLRMEAPGAGIGSQIRACGQRYRIVGILQPHAGSDIVQALEINASAMVASRIFDTGSLDSQSSDKNLLVRLRAGTSAQTFAEELTARTQLLLPDYSVQASGAWEFIKMRQEQASVYARFLAVLGGVSLLVGALGICNMMLVSVSERRAEIGLRMAIGAKRADIVAQFLVEGVLICVVGAALGLLLGWGVAKLALGLGGFDAVLPASVILKASLLAVGCGIVSGAYPAHRAAAVEPVSSLQG
jgi:putative ABC transport system permease protein